jgi:hypothetical protein
MNVRVEAGSIIVNFKSTLVEPTLKVGICLPDITSLLTTWTCFTLTQPTVNGHSLSAIDPKDSLIGGMATLAMA